MSMGDLHLPTCPVRGGGAGLDPCCTEGLIPLLITLLAAQTVLGSILLLPGLILAPGGRASFPPSLSSSIRLSLSLSLRPSWYWGLP